MELLMNFKNFLVFVFGHLSIIILMFVIIKYLCLKFEEVMHRQTKIRCLCKHEYTLDWKFKQDWMPTEYQYTCRKCGKVLNIKVVRGDGHE